MSFLSNLFHPANNNVPAGYPPIQSGPPGMPMEAGGPTYPTTGAPAQSAIDPTTGLPLQPGMPNPAYPTDTYAPLFNVPQHTPSLVPGAVVGFLSYNHLQPQVRVRSVRVPKTVTEQVQVPVRSSRSSRVSKAYDPVDQGTTQDPALDESGTVSRSTRAASASRSAAGATEESTSARVAGGRASSRAASSRATSGGVKVTSENGKVTIQVDNPSAPAASEAPARTASTPMRGPNGRFLPRDPQATASDAPVDENNAPITSDTGDVESTPGAASTDVAADEPAVRTVTKSKTVMVSKTKVNASPVLPTSELMGVVKSSMLWSGGISLACNLYSLAKGQESVADAGSNVAGDVTSGAVSGLGGAVVSSLGTAAIASAFGIAGGPLTLISFALGLGGYWAIDKLLRKTSIFKSLTSDVHQMLGGGPTYFPPQPAYAYGSVPGAPAYGTTPSYGTTPAYGTVPGTVNPSTPINLGSIPTTP